MNDRPAVRILGFPVSVHWSAWAVVAFLAFVLGSSLLPAAGVTGPGVWVSAVAGALLFFGSLLAHELAHAVVARRYGMRVEGIRLWLFGGVAQLRDESPGPKAEMAVAGAGPATSLALAIVLGVAAVGSAAVGLVLPAATLGWLAFANAVLTAFNLLPGAPLDGGRLLRGLLWWRSGDRLRATVSAANAGRVVGWGLVGLGVVQFFFGGFGGLWTAVIGWFIASSARAEGASAVARQALASTRVRDVLWMSPPIVPAWRPTSEVLHDPAMAGHDVVVVDRGSYAPGVVSLRRLALLSPDGRAQPLGVHAPDAPAAERSVDPDASVVEVLEGFDGRPVVVREQGLVRGVLLPADVLRLVQEASRRRMPPLGSRLPSGRPTGGPPVGASR